MNRTKVKICGVTNLIDAKNAFNLGADFVGLNNISGTKRYISCEDIDLMVSELNEDEVSKLVLLTDFDSADSLISLASQMQIKYLQPYAQFSTKDLVSMQSLGFKIFMPLRVRSIEDVQDIDAYKSAVTCVILDSKVDGELGGTGQSFDWKLFKEAKYSSSTPLGLAGGLNPTNIQEALKLEPYLLDISSGVEQAPGIKSVELMKELFSTLSLC